MAFNPFIIVEVWDRTNSMLIAELPRRWDVQGSDPLNIPGVGQVAVAMDDAVLDRHPTLLNMGNWVKFWLGDGLGNGEYIGAFQIRRRRLRFINTEEWRGLTRTVSGPMAHGLLLDFIVKHETQPPRSDSSETRSYAWTAKEGPWYDAADWNTDIISEGSWNTHITNARSGTVVKPLYKPIDWPDPSSDWIRGSGGADWQFFRRKYTIPSGGLLVKIFFSADEIGAVFLDGDAVIKRDEYENGYESFSEYKTFLPAGEHQFAILMRTKNTPGGDGIDALLFCVASLKTNGKVNEILFRSKDDANWECHATLPPPGWRQAQILISMIEEAQTRQVQAWDASQLLSLGFNGDDDSHSDPWVIELSRSFRVGTKVLDAQSQLSEVGSFDVWIDYNASPTTFTVMAALARGSDLSNNMALEPGRNLIDWTVDEVDNITNDATVRYDGGWMSYQASTSITDNGSREVGIALGQVGDDETASIIAGSHVERRKHARKRAGASPDIERDEDSQPTAAFVAVQGTCPFLNFKTGDYLKVPGNTGVKSKQRLINLTYAEDNTTGYLSFDPEFIEED